MPLSTRTRYALVGVAVGMATAGYIIVRLVEASGPQPTTLQLHNASPNPLTLTSLRLGGQPVLDQAARLPAAAGGGSDAAPQTDLRVVPLAPGRPVTAELQLQGQSAPLACTMEPRPVGACVARFTVTAASALACEFSCTAAEAPK